MRIDWKLFTIILAELVIVVSLCFVVGTSLMRVSPDMDLLLLTFLSLIGGYVLAYILFFIFGLILGLFAHLMLDNEQFDNFVNTYLRRPEASTDEIYEEADLLPADQENTADKQVAVLSATLDEISENKIGMYLEKEIPEWIKVNGEKYIFSHVLAQSSAGQFEMLDADLQTNDVIYPPGIVFRKEV